MAYATIVSAFNTWTGGTVNASILPITDNTLNLGSSSQRWASVFALALNAGASGLTISSNSLTQLTFSSSASRPLLTTAGRLSLDYTIDAGVVGGAIANVLAIVQAGNATSPLNQTRQWAFYGANVATSAATHGTLACIGSYNAVTTANSAFVAPNRYQFFGEGSTAKGAASTITRDAVYGGSAAAQGTNNAFLTDNTAYTGTYGIHVTSGSANVLTASLIYGTATVASAATITALASTTSVVKLSGSTATSLQGITAPATGTQDGQRMIVYSVGANLTVANENAGASAANRITTCTGADVVGTAPCAFSLVYDSTSTRWILVSSNT